MVLNMSDRNDIQQLANSLDADPAILSEIQALSKRDLYIKSRTLLTALEELARLTWPDSGQGPYLRPVMNTLGALKRFRTLLDSRFPEFVDIIPKEFSYDRPGFENLNLLIDTKSFSADELILTRRLLRYLRAVLSFIVAESPTFAAAVDASLEPFLALKVTSEYFESQKTSS